MASALYPPPVYLQPQLRKTPAIGGHQLLPAHIGTGLEQLCHSFVPLSFLRLSNQKQLHEEQTLLHLKYFKMKGWPGSASEAPKRGQQHRELELFSHYYWYEKGKRLDVTVTPNKAKIFLSLHPRTSS